MTRRRTIAALVAAGVVLLSSCTTRPSLPPVPATPEVQPPAASPPVVHEPLFRITSIGIGRDVLVTTTLAIGLAIENPNEFPLAFRSLAYAFYGEGELWTDGRFAGPIVVPAGGKAEFLLKSEMSFADMDRRLLDLVAGLKTVNYRFSGETSIAVEGDIVPAFSMRFDEGGSCAVSR